MTITETSAQEIDKILPVACSSAHNGEFTGVWDAPDGAYPTDANARKTANLNGCRAVVAVLRGHPQRLQLHVPDRPGRHAVQQGVVGARQPGRALLHLAQQEREQLAQGGRHRRPADQLRLISRGSGFIPRPWMEPTSLPSAAIA